LQGGVVVLWLILAGCEGNHVVERSYFHRYEWPLSTAGLHDSVGVPKTASMSELSGNPLVDSRLSTNRVHSGIASLFMNSIHSPLQPPTRKHSYTSHKFLQYENIRQKL